MSFINKAASRLILPAFERDLSQVLKQQVDILAKWCTKPTQLKTKPIVPRGAVEQMQKTPRQLVSEPHVPGRLGLALVLNRAPTYCFSARCTAKC